MRKIAMAFCVVATLFSCIGCQKKYTHGVYEVTITYNMLSNNSVGNDWEVGCTCEGRTITSGEQWTVPLDTEKTVIIESTITENDKWPDVNSCFIPVVLTDGFETSSIITVAENKGRYKGNYAQWEIDCKVKLINKVVQE